MGLFDITGIGAVADVVKELIQLFPNAEQRERAASKIQDAELAIAQGQMAVNAEEAKNPSMFVAGWRPFIGWCCGAGFAYATIGQPVLAWVAGGIGVSAPPLPDTTVLITTLSGMLGLGTLRTAEKMKGVASSIVEKVTKKK